MDIGRSPDVYLNEMAREIAPVRMTGNYGGEVLRRVRTFKPAEPFRDCSSPSSSPLSVWRERHIQGSAMRTNFPLPSSSRVLGTITAYSALEQTQLSLRTPFLDNDLIRTVFRAPESALAGSEDSLRLIADGKRELPRIPTDRAWRENAGALSVRPIAVFCNSYSKRSTRTTWGCPRA